MFDRLKGGVIHHIFESQVECTPDAVAVVFEGQQLTYRDLNYRANQLARYLQNCGVKPEVLVGICLERSLQIVVAILAILKAGGAYVPLDPTYPQERLAFMLEDSQVLLLLTQASLVESIPKHQSRVICLDTDWETISCESEENPDTEVNTENLAYVLYTSGSTGKPKGVCCNHLGVINLLADFDRRQPLSVGDACSLWTSLSFDVSVYEIFSALLTGGALHIVPEHIRADAKIFIEWLYFERICSAYIPHFMLNVFFDRVQKAPNKSCLKRLLVGVEPIYEQLLASISKKNPGLQIINGYGPTEATICATLYSVDRETTNKRNTPIGKPVQNTEVYLLNEQIQPVSPGETAEIYIGGIGLARGYLNRPNLTAEKFIVNPFSNEPGSRLYKTGDLARYLPDGNIEFVGRIDHQVKIRGFRIELAEIEASLRQHPDVREAVAIAREDVPGDKRLVAYIVSNLIPERIPYQSPCLVGFDGNRTIEVTTEDISIGGISLVGMTEILERGSSVRLHLQLPENSQFLWVEGKVVWQEEQQTGIQFELTPTQQIIIQQSLDYLLEKQKLLKVLQRSVTRTLRNFLKQKLPEYMVPSNFVVLKELPLTPNGKLDRQALPSPRPITNELSNSNIETVTDIVYKSDVLEQEPELELMPFVPPRTPVEEVLGRIWAEILGLDRVGIHDNFWECGGHSLLAAQVISRIRNTLEIELSLRSLFEAPTIAELAQQIETELQTNSRLPLSPIKVIDRDQNLPLSFGEQQMWLLAQVEPGNPFYNEHFTIYLPSSIDRLALEQSFNQIIDRHEILRTNFSVFDGQPIRIVQPSCYLPLPLINFQEIASESDRETEALRFVKEKARQPFNLTSDLLLRATLIQISETDYRLYITVHHIILDAVSLYSVLFPELVTLYEAICDCQPSSLPQLTVQYADFAYWQRQQLQVELLKPQLAYWKQQLADLPPLNLPTDRPRPPVQRFRGAMQTLALSKSLTEALKALSRQENVTLFMTLMAVFKILLYRYSGQEDIPVATVTGGRNRPEIEGLIGYFLNTLILRTDLSGFPSFRQLLSREREVALGAYVNQELPFEKVVEELQPERKLGQNPLFQVLFILEPPIATLDSKDWQVNQMDIHIGTSKCDLFLQLEETPQGIVGRFEYDTDLFDATTISQMVGHFLTLLESIVANPEQSISKLSLLTIGEQKQLINWNATEAHYSQNKCIHQLFEDRVEQNPHAVAVIFEGQQLTYQELNQRANQLAHHLRSLGVVPDTVVGICVERSLEMAIGLLGILKAGAAYLPLDPAYPQERIAYMLENAGVPVVLTQASLLPPLLEYGIPAICLDRGWKSIAQRPQDNPTTAVLPDHLAYVIYTSGSTGKPKGVAMSHSPLVNLIDWQLQNFAFPATKTLQFAPISFDVSFQECFTSWFSGGTLVLISDMIRKDAVALLQLLQDEAIERLFLPFIALQHLAEVAEEQGTVPNSLQEIITAGEQLQISRAIVNWFSQLKDCTLHNQYGPSESHVVTAFTLTGSPENWPKLPSIGRPIANAKIHILDSQLQPVPIGIPGELYIGGVSLANGYINRPDLTSQRFIENPFLNSDELLVLSSELKENSKLKTQNSKLYKTGDLARYLPDGNIEYMGRIDDQVKIRGFRIELGEIETALAQHQNIAEAVVIVREDIPGDKRLVAYVVASKELAPSANELRHFLQEKLPEYMIPNAFLFLETLPLTPSGKVNRRILPAPEGNREELETAFIAPRTPVEEKLAEIWKKILGIDRVGIYDRFFDLGGHSLKVTHLMFKVRDAFQVEVSLRQFLEVPTIAGTADAIALASQTDSTTTSAKEKSIDLNAEAILDPSISPENINFEWDKEPSHILLTGATGFLGTHLLNDLLKKTQANIYCLVRASNLEQGIEKIQKSLERYLLYNQPISNRIIPVLGDLSQPFLGLTSHEFRTLASKLDVIYHNGASTNLVYPYSALKAVNVLSTQEVLRLACIIKVKPVHFVSTIGVFSSDTYEQNTVVREQDELPDSESLCEGYDQSKWVAEKLVMTAYSRGLPVYIYRPGFISGDSQTGICNTADLLRRMLKGCIQMGKTPDLDIMVDMTPVDYVSQAIVHLSKQKELVGKAFHLVNPHPIPWNQLFDFIRSLGYSLERIPYKQWNFELLKSVENSTENALHPLISLFADEAVSLQTVRSISICFDSQKAIDGLVGSCISCPPIDERLLNTYLSYLLKFRLTAPYTNSLNADYR
ncbi:non-ribosomal peptide synthetase [Microcoleus asticus]|uniref:Linear gramicidin synthase subunit D n=1 Tax=Microcoleus asticus IPMA8 TaxID=2563858 RepID=A0ABX2D390_9CYAN|nr:non-ribosomal peptide synthetase [Microcoleus asticus]NQE37105.1 Linear gramicidin synthase subunit D [Microcoleus asticus IPMA8]